MYVYTHYYSAEDVVMYIVQWNLSNLDTLGIEESVPISEVF